MSESRQPDIEVYVAAPVTRIVAWLTQHFAWSVPLTPARRGGMAIYRGTLYRGTLGGHRGTPRVEAIAVNIPVLIVAETSDGFTSVLFDSPDAPWADDLACAKEFATALDCDVRCVDGTWQPDQPDDEGWLQVSRTGARAIRWKPA